MKVNILFPIKNEPSGGGNQFLAALRNEFRNSGVYSERPEDANVLLFNSYPFGNAASLYRMVAKLKAEKAENLTVIHRVDGPISIVRGNARDFLADRSLVQFNQKFADATIFQSAWSRAECLHYGISTNIPGVVISNAPDKQLFYPKSNISLLSERRIRIVISSWSSNWRKGFDIYRYLDQHLDFERYDVIFVGNSPIDFLNINRIDPLPSVQLSDLLRQCDIFLTASVDDPCSNAVIEALCCGLPVVARNSGGHPEIIGSAGILFEGKNDVLEAIDRCAEGWSNFRENIKPPDIESIGQQYLQFAQKVSDSRTVAEYASEISPSTNISQLLASVAMERYGSAITKRICSTLPIREDHFYRDIKAFRKAAWEPNESDDWEEPLAIQWLRGVLNRLPLFLDSMRHAKRSDLYRFSFSGDLQEEPGLASSVFVAKIRYMTGLLDNKEVDSLSKHILSFQRADGAIADLWVEKNSRLGRLKMAALSRSLNNLNNVETVRAETRQAFAALHCLSAKPSRPFLDIPSNKYDIEKYVLDLNWSRPWSAGSHISHLVFFLHHHALWFEKHDHWAATDILSFVESKFRQHDGAWYAKNAQISATEKVNGAMKMITAFDAVEVDMIANPEGLIDLCLGVLNDGHACNHFNVICVLHRCLKLTDYRASEIRGYCLKRLRLYRDLYWPWQGGFSFYASGANDSYYNARISTGMAEPDVHGTVLILWGIVLIAEMLGWGEELNLKRPIT